MSTGYWLKKFPDDLVAGEIASLLVLPPTNLSFHLKALAQAGLLRISLEGRRYQRYRANLVCNGQVKQDTFLSRLLVGFPIKFQRGMGNLKLNASVCHYKTPDNQKYPALPPL